MRFAETGIHGEFFLPADTSGRRPAVLVLGGSGGGIDEDVRLNAGLLAVHGYPALALAYFAAPGLPPALARILLEYYTRALGLLARQPGVDPERMVVSGRSRGSEAALLLGVHFPALVHGVIAAVPTNQVGESYPRGADAAWTLRGMLLPAAPASTFTYPNPTSPAPRSSQSTESAGRS